MKLGQVVMTREINAAVANNEDFSMFVTESRFRYCRQDWGDLCASDKRMNDSAVKNNDYRMVAHYNNNAHGDIYIITEWDRSVTTILFTHEY